MSKNGFNVVILKTDGSCVQQKIKSCEVVLKKNESIEKHLKKYLILSTNNEFEYIGKCEYNNKFNCHFFRLKTNSRIKNKHLINVLNIETSFNTSKKNTKNLNHITNEIWVLKSLKESKLLEHIYVRHWQSFYNKSVANKNKINESKNIQELKESQISNNKTKIPNSINESSIVKNRKSNKTKSKNNNKDKISKSSNEIEDDDDNNYQNNEDNNDDDNEDYDNEEEDNQDENNNEDNDEDNDEDNEDEDNNEDNDEENEVKEEDLENEDYEEQSNEDDDDNHDYQEDDNQYEDLRNVDLYSDNSKNRKTNKKSFSKSNKDLIKKKEEDLDIEIEKGSVVHLLKKENTLINVKSLVELRKKCLKIIQSLFTKNEKNLSREVEKGIYNYSIQKCIDREMYPSWDNKIFKEIYLGKCKSIYTNLNSKSYVKNTDLIHKVKLKEIQPDQLANLKPVEIFPEMWEHIIKENEHREKVINESMMGSATDKFVCPNKKCRARKAVYTEVQTRSADEPMTLFISCLVCGHRWRM